MTAGQRRRIGVLVIAFFAPSWALPARADEVGPQLEAGIDVPFPEGAPLTEVVVHLELTIGKSGEVESAIVVSTTPADAPRSLADAILRNLATATFRPYMQDGRPTRARVRHVVVFKPPSEPSSPASPTAEQALSASSPSAKEPDEGARQEVVIRGVGWGSPRGIGDVRVTRDLLEASPRQQTSEMLSAAPGFFVDHEDGEGLGNDVYLRGFDLEHGSGIEMRVGTVPINIPLHIQGQGYADANFIIPEVVHSVRVLEGPFDPRQGDAAIVGSAYFDLAVPERGYRLRSSYGSFRQMRIAGIIAPPGAESETFTALSLRKTDGFGTNREGLSASVNSQYGVELGPWDRLRILATGYGAQSSLAGVVREDDVDANRIGFYGSYPYFTRGQGARSARFILGAAFEHDGSGGARLEVAPWFMWTDFRARQNFAGNLESSQIDPRHSGVGDLFETVNRETAVGVTSRLRSAPVRIGSALEAIGEPGIYARFAHTDQTKSLLVPGDLERWDRRNDAGIESLDIGAYFDLDARLSRRLHLSGGPRADLLGVWVDDRLAGTAPVGTRGIVSGARRKAIGLAPGVHATVEYDVARWMAPAISYGQGFRSLAVERLSDGSSQPFSKVRSIEAGLKVLVPDERYVTRLSVFETRVGNELVFEATSGGLESQNTSVRRGFVGSLVAKPVGWLLASTAVSVTSAVFATRVPGISHYVPNVPSVLFHTDATARGRVTTLRARPITGRVGVGYTLLAGRHLTDTIQGPAHHVVNAGAALRYASVEVALDAYNVLGSLYPDDEQVYVSNWSLRPGQQPASLATHITAAPPRTLLGNLSLYF